MVISRQVVYPLRVHLRSLSSCKEQGLKTLVRVVMTFLLIGLGIVGELVGQVPAGGKAEAGVVRAEMIVGMSDFSAPFTVGLRFELAPDWYLYWFNPGDAGLAMEVRWLLPVGLEAGSLLYPIPEKFISGEMVAFGYKKEVVILCLITPKAGFKLAGETSIAAEVDWLVCKESCLAGRSRVEMVVSKLGENALRRGSQLLDDYRHRLPQPASKADIFLEAVKTHCSGRRFEVEVSFDGPAASQLVDFYPYPLAEGMFVHFGIRVERGKLLIPLELFDTARTPSAIRGLLILKNPKRGHQGYEIEIPVLPSAALLPFPLPRRLGSVARGIMESKTIASLPETIQFLSWRQQ